MFWDKTHTDQNFTCAHSDPSVMMYIFIFEGWHGKPQEAPKFSQEEEPRPGMFEASSMAGGWEESPGWHLQLPSPGKNTTDTSLNYCSVKHNNLHMSLYFSLYWEHFACMVLSSVYFYNVPKASINSEVVYILKRTYDIKLILIYTGLS